MIRWVSALSFIFYSITTIGQPAKPAFLGPQLKEYKRWMDASEISYNLNLRDLSYVQQADVLIITLNSAYQSLDSLSSAWKAIDNRLVITKKISLAELLHQQGSFLFDQQPQQFRILVEANPHKDFREIYFTTSIQDKRTGVMGGNPIVIPVKELKLPTTNKKITLTGKPLIQAVTQGLARNLQAYYNSKPSSWFYNVRLDTSRSFFNSLTYRVTCLKNEILDDNYFEFIEIKLDVAQQGDGSVEVRTDIKGKYCGGLRCPNQREKFYYSMDGKYDGKQKSYADLMENRIKGWLSK